MDRVCTVHLHECRLLYSFEKNDILNLLAYISLLYPTYIANFLAGSADCPVYQSIYAMLIGVSSGAYLEAGASGYLGYSPVSGNDGFIIMGLEVGMGEEVKVLQIEAAETTSYLFYRF
jgi:hypothetical protein